MVLPQVLYFLCFEIGSYYPEPWLLWSSGELNASASQVLGLKSCVTTPGHFSGVGHRGGYVLAMKSATVGFRGFVFRDGFLDSDQG